MQSVPVDRLGGPRRAAVVGGNGFGDVRRAIIDLLAEQIASSERIAHASLVLRANR